MWESGGKMEKHRKIGGKKFHRSFNTLWKTLLKVENHWFFSGKLCGKWGKSQKESTKKMKKRRRNQEKLISFDAPFASLSTAFFRFFRPAILRPAIPWPAILLLLVIFGFPKPAYLSRIFLMMSSTISFKWESLRRLSSTLLMA